MLNTQQLGSNSFGMTMLKCIDKPLLLITLALLSVGIVAISSASIEISEATHNHPFYHLWHHLLYLVIALFAASIIAFIPMSLLEKWGWLLLIASLLLLILVLIPGIGHKVNGSMRWVRAGPFNLQVSEITKLCVIIYLSGYLVRRLSEVRSQISGFIKPMVVIALMIVLLLLEPDFGAVVVLLSAVLGMMFLGGVRLSQFLILIGVSLVAVILMAVSQPYRMQRLVTFMDPWAKENVYDSGYQLTQALIAFGRGEWFGVGLGNSVQKLFYLPEAHTDFVFAIMAEETGLIGAVIVTCLLAALSLRILCIGKLAEKQHKFFSAYLAYGIGLLFGTQALINIGVNTGVLPTKGLTLPFLSYGGSSLISNCAAVTLILRINYEIVLANISQDIPVNHDAEPLEASA